MTALTVPDLLALGFFIVTWAVYDRSVRRGWRGKRSLNQEMDGYRLHWMVEMSQRDVRIVDSAIIATLQNGTAFFASTSLLAIGGVATMLRASDDMLKIFSEISIGLQPTRVIFETKVIGLLIIFGYAFFKFAWAYRLYNFAAILIGATPPRASEDAAGRRKALEKAAAMNVAAGRHFARGQRAFFFALAYLGWFLGPYAFVAATASVIFVMWSRQFRSDARKALEGDAA